MKTGRKQNESDTKLLRKQGTLIMVQIGLVHDECEGNPDSAEIYQTLAKAIIL